MISVAPGTKVYLACQPVSMRLGFDGLAARVSQVLRADPFSGHLFLFRGKRAKRPTFRIQFTLGDHRLSMAPPEWADVPGLVTPSRQRPEVHLYGRTA